MSAKKIRVWATVPAEYVKALNDLVDAGVYVNRTDAIRTAIRKLISKDDTLFTLDKRLSKLEETMRVLVRAAGGEIE